MQRLTACAVALLSAGLAWSGNAMAHGGAHAGGHPEAAWNFDPLTLASLVALAAVYAVAVVRTWRRTGVARVFGMTQLAAFAGAIAALAAALVSPIDRLGEQLFSVHMVQHLILILMAAPLLIVARPGLAVLQALPAGARRSTGLWWAGGALARTVRRLGHPLVAWLLYMAVFLFWHLPGPYQWALAHEAVHVGEHVSLFVAAILFWSFVIRPQPRWQAQHGMRLFYVATAAVAGSLPGALIFLAGRPFYPAHVETVRAWGLTPLEDQQFAGLIMWVPGGLFYLAAVAVLFLAWIKESERRARIRERSLRRPFEAAPGQSASPLEATAGRVTVTPYVHAPR